MSLPASLPTLAPTTDQAEAPPAPRTPLAARPPLTFAAVRRRWPAVPVLALLVPLVLGIAATIDGGRLLFWDTALTETAVAHRTPWLDDLALAVSLLGAWVVVYPVGALLAVAASRRSRTLAWVIVVTVAARPAIEWLLKDIVARPRPDGARLVAGTGYSYPSGHVLAVVATWAFLPMVVALYTHRRALWWATLGAAGTIVALVSWSRVWLGVHWASDVAASLLLAFVALSAAEAWLARSRLRPAVGSEAHAPGDPPRVASSKP